MSSSVEIVEVAGARGGAAREFIELPFGVFAGSQQWVPWFRTDLRALLARRHPFFEKNEGAFFLARRDGAPRGRIAVLENRGYNATHRVNHAQFYFLDLYQEEDVARALFEAAFAWARARGLTALTGPLGFAATGAGLLVEGFEHRGAMTMMSYNHPYYPRFLEMLGFSPYLDLYSYHIVASEFRLPDRVRSIAEKVLKRGAFRVLEFRSKDELRKMAPELGRVYNESLSDHRENYAMSAAEIERVTKDLLLVADPPLIKVLAYRDKIVGFLFGFPDLSAALQRAGGRLDPLRLLGILREFKRTDWLIINGAGILPEYQRLGGNALLYYELERTVHSGNRFSNVDLTQIAQTTGLMLSDVETLGATHRYKVHRVFTRAL